MSPAEQGKSTHVLAVDTGGTFTDLLLLRNGRIRVLKVPSTPEDPAAAVLEGIRLLLGDPSGALEPFRLIHGSTVATNALLERTGARVVLITNEGFEDLLEIGRQDRPQLYALSGRRSPPLVGRDDRIGVRGRLDRDGTEHRPLDAEELAELAERIEGAESIAISLLHGYANASHEEAVAEALESTALPCSLSSRILPEFREFERTATTVVNAYVAPKVARYLTRIGEHCGAERFRIMGSNGGALSLSRATREPVHTVLSGPAGGVVAALDWARRSGIERVLSFDMGGTSTDVSLVPGRLLHTREGRIGETPVAVPLLDIHTVGAGGGSIAWIDPGGALRVGPQSAGASPGPVSYGRGGTRVTVTDANVWLGRIPARGLLGGDAPLDRAAIEKPLAALASAASTSPDSLAEGIITVANAAMERALRVISVERGVDPAGFHLVAFGGAAGLHAAELAGRIGLRGALIPPDPGLLSAFGMLVAPVVRDRSRTVLVSSERDDRDAVISGAWDDLARAALEELREELDVGAELRTERSVDVRYRGQSFEIRVPAEDWIEAFHSAHEERYGYARRGATLEAVTLRVRAHAPGEAVRISQVEGPREPDFDQPAEVLWEGRRIHCDVVRRSHLPVGRRLQGPLIVTEYSSTSWCPPGWEVERDPLGSLHLLPIASGRGSTRR